MSSAAYVVAHTVSSNSLIPRDSIRRGVGAGRRLGLTGIHYPVGQRYPDGMATDPTAPEPRRLSIRLPHWGWFLLLTVALIIAGIGLSFWLPYYRQQRVIQEIETLAGSVRTERGGPDWLRQHLGANHIRESTIFEQAVSIDLEFTEVTDVQIAHLIACRNLRSLNLAHTQVSDSVLGQLAGLTNLEVLDLSETAITDAGLRHLSGLKKLEDLSLSATAVSDDGLPHVGELTKLRRLILDGTTVTDSGLARLRGLVGLERLYLIGTKVTDAGLSELSGLTKLEILDLDRTSVTNAGLVDLSTLTNLQELFLRQTKVTRAGTEKLKNVLPNCQIYR